MKSLTILTAVCAAVTYLVSGATTPASTDITHNKDCLLPTVPGRCKGYFPRFSYHPNTKQCQQFIYGGCMGNANNFMSLEECNQACATVQHSALSEDICNLPTTPGMCKGYFPRFSYHPATNECKSFIYGGCDGNQNNFDTVEECNTACVKP